MPATYLMRSNLRIISLVFILATVFAGPGIVSCNVGQAPDKNLTNSRTTELVGKYKGGKDVFKKHCNTCHIPPDKKASDQQLFDNLFNRQSSDYVIKFIGDSKKLKLSGDKYALALDKVFNSDYEHFFVASLTSSDFDNLIIYLKVATH